MKRVIVSFAVVVAGIATTLSVTASRYQETVQAETFVGPLEVGGLTIPEAEKRVRVWWESQRLHEITLEIPAEGKSLPERSLTSLGLVVDDVATIQQLPLASLTDRAESIVSQGLSPAKHFQIVYRVNSQTLAALGQEVDALLPKPEPARINFEKGSILRKYEVAAKSFDAEAAQAELKRAAADLSTVEIPLKVLPKSIPDDALNSVQDIVSEFTTHFPASNRPRCSNIKLAAKKLDGVILLPGEQLSFNGTVGRRTLKRGFRLAGVYKNGKHDTGVGGGICQVSTTLYNAALLADLQIRRRSNHSMPVAYVPLGRDATVDYGNLDLVVQNSFATPIVVTSLYRPGALTFRLLGQKVPGLVVKITTRPGNVVAKPMEVRTLPDPKLPLGRKKIVEKGSIVHAVYTYRWIYRDGVLQQKESLGRSYYGGSERVVAIGTKPPKAASP